MTLGVFVVLLATLAIIFGAFRAGTSMCKPDQQMSTSSRNTAIVVIAVGMMFLMCGILMTIAGSSNPMNAVIAK